MLEQQEKKVEKIGAADAIHRMIQAINYGKTDSFYSIAEGYRESFTKHGAGWHRINTLVKNRPQQVFSLNDIKTKFKDFVVEEEVEQPVVFLSPEVQKTIDDLLAEFQFREALREKNFPVRSKLLLHGASGNGKTTIAKYIAKVSGLGFLQVTTESLIKGRLGESGDLIQKLLKGINTPCVLFLDEFDSLAITRSAGNGTSSDHENARIVNSLLVHLEKMNPDVLFIAATNRMEDIDYAVKRRMDELIHISDPTREQMVQYANMLCNYHGMSDDLGYSGMGLIPELVKDCHNLSEVKKTIQKVGRKAIIEQCLVTSK